MLGKAGELGMEPERMGLAFLPGRLILVNLAAGAEGTEAVPLEHARAGALLHLLQPQRPQQPRPRLPGPLPLPTSDPADGGSFARPPLAASAAARRRSNPLALARVARSWRGAWEGSASAEGAGALPGAVEAAPDGALRLRGADGALLLRAPLPVQPLPDARPAAAALAAALSRVRVTVRGGGLLSSVEGGAGGGAVSGAGGGAGFSVANPLRPAATPRGLNLGRLGPRPLQE